MQSHTARIFLSKQNKTKIIFKKEFGYFDMHVHIEIHISYDISEICCVFSLALPTEPIYLIDVHL